MINYGFKTIVNKTVDETVKIVTEEFKKEGFGILTRIDVHDKFKEKLGIDFKKYVILGACNPQSAHQAISLEEDIGLLLPCNVAVYEKDDKVAVSIIKPSVAMGFVENSKLEIIANDIENKLENVFNSLV